MISIGKTLEASKRDLEQRVLEEVQKFVDQNELAPSEIFIAVELQECKSLDPKTYGEKSTRVTGVSVGVVL